MTIENIYCESYQIYYVTKRTVLKPIIGGGKVTIPKRVRDDLDLEKGDEVLLTVRPASEVVDE